VKRLTKGLDAEQLDLFGSTIKAYLKNPDGELTNSQLYSAVGSAVGTDPDAASHHQPVGKSGAVRNLFHRQIRWYQQTLKSMGILERVNDKRGVWRLSDKAQKELLPVRRTVKVLGFSTELGVALWSHAEDGFENLDQEVMLCFTSSPYPLSSPRAYGNVRVEDFVDFICESLKPVIERLSDEGSLVLNLSNDIFLSKSPGRSTYLERVMLALEDRMGLTLMDRIPWINPSKPPGPTRWASITRQQLNVSWEPILWFAKNPLKVKSDNRRVLVPHTERHARLIAQGGESRTTDYGDGAYRLRAGSFSNPTAGAIPKNVINRSHRCAWGDQYKRYAEANGLPSHGAGMPYSIAEFFIALLTDVGDLVADPFGGRIMTGRAAESLGRRWWVTERMLQYVAGGAGLFRDAKGFEANPVLSLASR
tara:strand:+ start:20175 stop:21437 length:1263 start_codon:yes stop_codon:yes gene_type:complete